MKKESVNTFSGGLVYDLNPITTPANVLTDNVNGTFLTFNGDELALQNDAGNTTISIANNGVEMYDPNGTYVIGNNVYSCVDEINKYYRNLTGHNDGTLNPTDWEELIVRLSPGFYPIGIKEYGGILYIISAKNPTIIPTQFNNNSFYNIGDVVYYSELGINYYYESLIDNNIWIPTITDKSRWLSIGTQSDFINKYGFIEFGSYPSPEIFNPNQFDSSVEFQCVNVDDPDTNSQDFQLELYSPKAINKSIFQAGAYVTFQNIGDSGGGYDFTEISHREFRETTLWTIVPKIYKVRLLHQLTNGFIDLTDDVWQKYAEYVYETTGLALNDDVIHNPIKFWFSDSNFKYYCPHNYKGKLAMTVELENLDVFEVDPITIEVSGPNYTLTLPIRLENSTHWMNNLTPSVTIAYTLNGDEPNLNVITTDNIILYNQTLTLVSHVGTIMISLPYANKGKTFKYKVVPEFTFGSNKYTPIANYFPQQFIDAHTIYGAELIRTKYDDYTILREFGGCDPDPYGMGYWIYDFLTLKKGLDFVDNTLTVTSGDKYCFQRVGTSLPSGYHSLGTFIVDTNNKAANLTYNISLPLSNQAYFTELIHNTIVREESSICNTLVPLIIKVNKDFGQDVPVYVIQGSKIISGARIHDQTTELKYNFLIQASTSFTIKAKQDTPELINGITSINLTHSGIATSTIINFGIITNVYVKNNAPGGFPTGVMTSTLYNYFNQSLFGPDVPSGFYSLANNGWAGTWLSFPISTPIKYLESGPFATYDYSQYVSHGYPSYHMYAGSSSINSSYDNLNQIGITACAISGNNIFVRDHILIPKP